MLVAVQTPRTLYVQAQARTIRLACRRVREGGTHLGTVATLLARGGANPWAEALAPVRGGGSATRS